MSDSPRYLSAADLVSLRACAAFCWQYRVELRLSASQLDQVLYAWMAVGTDAEAEAATEFLAARHKVARKQANFDGLLGFDVLTASPAAIQFPQSAI